MLRNSKWKCRSNRFCKSGVKFATANPSYGGPPPASAQGYGAAGHSKARVAR
jgi:hypothetical protein